MGADLGRPLVRRVNLTGLGFIQDPAVRSALQAIELASAEVDLTDIASAFTVSGAYTQTRSLNVTSPTLANAVAVLATFIDDCKRGGTNRST
jgi:hypothetical protein